MRSNLAEIKAYTYVSEIKLLDSRLLTKLKDNRHHIVLNGLPNPVDCWLHCLQVVWKQPTEYVNYYLCFIYNKWAKKQFKLFNIMKQRLRPQHEGTSIVQDQLAESNNVRVVQTWLQEIHRECVGFPRLETNRTQLQLIRSYTFLLDSGVPYL